MHYVNNIKKEIEYTTLMYRLILKFWLCSRESSSEDLPVVNLTESISSAFFPRFRYTIYLA